MRDHRGSIIIRGVPRLSFVLTSSPISFFALALPLMSFEQFPRDVHVVFGLLCLSLVYVPEKFLVNTDPYNMSTFALIPHYVFDSFNFSVTGVRHHSSRIIISLTILQRQGTNRQAPRTGRSHTSDDRRPPHRAITSLYVNHKDLLFMFITMDSAIHWSTVLFAPEAKKTNSHISLLYFFSSTRSPTKDRFCALFIDLVETCMSLRV